MYAHLFGNGGCRCVMGVANVDKSCNLLFPQNVFLWCFREYSLVFCLCDFLYSNPVATLIKMLLDLHVEIAGISNRDIRNNEGNLTVVVSIMRFLFFFSHLLLLLSFLINPFFPSSQLLSSFIIVTLARFTLLSLSSLALFSRSPDALSSLVQLYYHHYSYYYYYYCLLLFCFLPLSYFRVYCFKHFFLGQYFQTVCRVLCLFDKIAHF